MSVTSEKREKFTWRYLRKDARTIIYAALLGPAGQANNKPRTRYNDPFADPTRQLVAPNWEAIKGKIRANWQDAAFDHRQGARIIRYFNASASEGLTISPEELA